MFFSRFYRRHRSLILRLALFASPAIPIIWVVAPDMPRIRVYDHLQSWIVHPVSEFLTFATRGASSIVDEYVLLVGAAQENVELKREIASLESQLLNNQEVELENERLKELLKVVEPAPYKYLSAKVIGEDPSGESLGFLISAGTQDGVQEGMAVLSANGIAGTVVRSFRGSAFFIALQDPSHIVDGFVARSRAQFMVQGEGSLLTGRMKYLDRAADLRVGDLVLTSGLDQVFPKGLPVGYVVEVNRPRSGVTQDARLRPSVDLSYLEEVIVVLGNQEGPSAMSR